MNFLKLFLLAILITFSNVLFSQGKAPFPNEYYYSILKGDSLLFRAKDPISAINEYRKAIQIANNKPNPYFLVKVAKAFVILNETDSVYTYLQKAIDSKDYEEISTIPEIESFKKYYNTDRWEQLVKPIFELKITVEKAFDKPLIAQLERIRNDDQSVRGNFDQVRANFGLDSKEAKEAILEMRKTDSLNSIFITNLLDSRGMLGKDIITLNGVTTIFLVIQHSTLENQIKYYSIFKEATEKGVVPMYELALLEDRIAIYSNKKQKYGSQISFDSDTQTYFVWPLEDPDNVDKYREEVGLNSIAEYISIWNIKWDIEEYKKHLPEYLKIQENEFK